MTQASLFRAERLGVRMLALVRLAVLATCKSGSALTPPPPLEVSQFTILVDNGTAYAATLTLTRWNEQAPAGPNATGCTTWSHDSVEAAQPSGVRVATSDIVVYDQYGNPLAEDVQLDATVVLNQ